MVCERLFCLAHSILEFTLWLFQASGWSLHCLASIVWVLHNATSTDTQDKKTLFLTVFLLRIPACAISDGLQLQNYIFIWIYRMDIDLKSKEKTKGLTNITSLIYDCYRALGKLNKDNTFPNKFMWKTRHPRLHFSLLYLTYRRATTPKLAVVQLWTQGRTRRFITPQKTLQHEKDIECHSVKHQVPVYI